MLGSSHQVNWGLEGGRRRIVGQFVQGYHPAVAVEQLRRDLDGLPTIMPLDVELAFISRLMQEPVADLMSRRDAFRSMLADLSESHTGGAIFEVDDSNIHLCRAFSTWLIEIADQAEAESGFFAELLTTSGTSFP